MAFARGKKQVKSPAKPAASPQPAKKPTTTIRFGQVKLAIWENPGDREPMYAATIEKIYNVNGEWKQTRSIDSRDWLAAAECFRLAWFELQEQKGGGVEVLDDERESQQSDADETGGDPDVNF